MVEYIQYLFMSPMDLLHGTKGKAFLDTLNLLLPNRCRFCGASLSSGVCVCDGCIHLLEIIDRVSCSRCGAPVDSNPISVDGACSQCRELSFLFGRNVSLGVFSGRLRNLIHAFKFEGRRSLHWFFADLLHRTTQLYIQRADVLAAVPLSTARYAERGYNQSFLLARSVARHADMPFVGRAIRRRGNAAPQSSISARQDRITNLSDTFAVGNRYVCRFRHKRILLVDDVLTTGATASACAEALLRAGASSVDVLTIARSLKGTAALYLSPNRPIIK
jgi:ComF family protein